MYKEIIPLNWASQFIESYWIYENKSFDVQDIMVPPDGCSDIIFSFNDEKISSWAVGCMSKTIKTHAKSNELMLGVRFKAGCASYFLNTSMNELTNKIYPLDNFLKLNTRIDPDIIKNKRELIHDILEEELKKIYTEKQCDTTITSAVTLIKRYHGTKSIDDIAYVIGISRRQLERKFLASIGISPKLYSRIIRFNYVNRQMQKTNNYPMLFHVLDAGYYDQAHFCKELNSFKDSIDIKK